MAKVLNQKILTDIMNRVKKQCCCDLIHVPVVSGDRYVSQALLQFSEENKIMKTFFRTKLSTV